MKNYSLYILIAVCLIVAGAIFIFWKNVKTVPQNNKIQKQETPTIIPPVELKKGTLEVTSPCDGVSSPVCGEDKKTYASECLANFLGVKVVSQGMCK